MGYKTHFESYNKNQHQVRLPGFEPGLQAWEAYVITAGPQPLYAFDIL